MTVYVEEFNKMKSSPKKNTAYLGKEDKISIYIQQGMVMT